MQTIVLFARWQSGVDFAALVVALYLLLSWARNARAIRVALAIIAFFSASLVAASHHLVVTSWLLEAAGVLTIVALFTIFQTEVRRALTRLDSLVLLAPYRVRGLDWRRAAISEACFALASSRTGALIVLVRSDPIDELVDDGIMLGAEVSSALLEALFQKTSPLHDGAVVVEGNLIKTAGTVLPLTSRRDVPASYGTRHRAAMGLAERCDALVVVVSEERGNVSVMEGRTIRHVTRPGDLAELLERQGARRQGFARAIARFAGSNVRVKLASIGLAVLLWILVVSTGSVVRTVNVPLVLAVPPGLDVSRQSAISLEVRLRGPEWILDTSELNDVVARINLPSAEAGSSLIHISPRDLSLPPGVHVEAMTPSALSVRLVLRGGPRGD